MSDTLEGNGNGVQEGGASEEERKVRPTADAKLTTEQNKAPETDERLDGNGNPKSEETLEQERSEKIKTSEAAQEQLNTHKKMQERVETRAKQVEDLVVSAGVEPRQLISEADPETGDISVAHKALLIEVHGEAIADLIENNVQKMIGDAHKVTEASDNAVYAQLETEFEGVTEQSGKDTWKELSGWVKENIDKDVRKEYNQMLSKGGIQAQLAVKAMVEAFKKNNDFTVKAELLEGDGQIATPSSKGFVTQREYRAQLDSLIASGHDYDSSPEIAALNRKRARSMQMGK